MKDGGEREGGGGWRERERDSYSHSSQGSSLLVQTELESTSYLNS